MRGREGFLWSVLRRKGNAVRVPGFISTKVPGRGVGEKEVVLIFLLGSVVLLGAFSAAERSLERQAGGERDGVNLGLAAALARRAARAVEESRTLPASGVEPARVTVGSRSAAVAPVAAVRVGDPAGYHLSDPERAAYFSLVAALDIQGRPGELSHLFMGTIRQESSFNPRAKHPVSGARGLTQFMAATGAAYGLTPSEVFEPVSNLQAFVEYFYDNVERFTHFSGVDSSGKRARIARKEAIKYSLIAHNLGPTALAALMEGGFCEAEADRFIRLLEERISTRQPLKYHNKYAGRDEMITVSKMVELVGFYGRIMSYAGFYSAVFSRGDAPFDAPQVAIRN